MVVRKGFLFIAAGFTWLMYSCEVHHFEKPQPVDVSNTYIFPKEFQGVWQDDKKEVTITLLGKTLRLEGFDSIKVPNNRSTEVILNRRYLKTIFKKSDESVSDTLINYVLKGDKIYEVTTKGLERGFPFIIKRDTIRYKKTTSIEFDLGPSVFLRKISESQYILNLQEQAVWQLLNDQVGPWWQIVLLEKKKNGRMSFRQIDKMAEKDPGLIYSTETDYYFDTSWTRTDFFKMIQNGVFADDSQQYFKKIK